MKGAAGKREKGNARFLNPALTDEYKWARTVMPTPRIFVGDATSPMSIDMYINR
jgi:hypothetical protein